MAPDDKIPPKLPVPPPLPSSAGRTPPPPPLPGAGAPSLPPMPGSGSMGMPPMPGMPRMPGLPGMSGVSAPPSPPSFSSRPARDPEKEMEAKVDKVKDEYEKKLSELSHRLQEEREKLLVTQLKSREEEATSAKVEISLKELQDRMRRDRREQESEESKLKLEKKAQELETRLAQERETWVVTLKNQLSARESQEKEVENHFAMRLQEMERRWLEEKANWQKIALGKDDEIRTLRSLAEKLKGADTEFAKVAAEKKILDERVVELSKDRAEAHARLQNASEREKEAIQLRADLTLSRQGGAMVQERLERDLSSLRASAREREERLMVDVERLQRDIATVKTRFDAEKDAELRRAKTEYEADLAQQKQLAERAQAELQRLRAVAGALERQSASARAQLEELKRAAVDWERTQERYKAEFVVLQRKWVEREKEVRAEASAQSLHMLESEKLRLRVQAQDEINTRAAKIADQLRQENESDLRRIETKLRADLEVELQARRQELQAESDGVRVQAEAEMSRLRRELASKDASWGERLLAKESEALAARARADDSAGRLSREEETRQAGERRALELEKSLQDARDESSRATTALRDVQRRLEATEAEAGRLEREKTEYERLTTAQAAQIHGSQEALEAARVQLAREAQLGKIGQNSKEQTDKAMAAQRQEFARAFQAQKEEFERQFAEREQAVKTEAARLEDVRRDQEKQSQDIEVQRQAAVDAGADTAGLRRELAAAKAEAENARTEAERLSYAANESAKQAAELGAQLEECRKNGPTGPTVPTDPAGPSEPKESWAKRLFKKSDDAGSGS